MNKKEKMAAAILVFTLTAGILVDLLEHRVGRTGGGREQKVVGGAPASLADSGSADSGSSLERDGVRIAGEGEPGGGGDEYRTIDINRAGQDELELLPGIGPKKAEAIIEWRSRHGRFRRLEDLLDVKGIGNATLERLRPFASVGE